MHSALSSLEVTHRATEQYSISGLARRKIMNTYLYTMNEPLFIRSYNRYSTWTSNWLYVNWTHNNMTSDSCPFPVDQDWHPCLLAHNPNCIYYTVETTVVGCAIAPHSYYLLTLSLTDPVGKDSNRLFHDRCAFNWPCSCAAWRQPDRKVINSS